MTADEKKPAPRLGWPLLCAIAALAVVVGVILVGRRGHRPPGGWNRPLEPVALVDQVQGNAQALRGTEPRPLSPGETIYTGESLRTEAGGALSLTTYPGEAKLGLGDDAALAFETPAEVRVVRGRLQAHVPDSVVQVFITPHGRIVTRETRLSIEVSVKGTQLAVTEGDARVEGPRGLRQVVAAGATMFLAAEAAPRD